MADRLLSLLDMTKRNGNDSAVGLIEEVNTVAPESTELMGRPISGVTYTALIRKALPGNTSNVGVAFRNANEGSEIISGQYEQRISQCFFLDGQMRVDEAVIRSGKAEGNSMSDVLADEATGIARSKLIQLGAQFYSGTSNDAKGFVGLTGLYDTTNCEVTAGGSTNTTSAYLVWNDIQGVHWIFGNNSGLMLGEWTRQQVTDSNSKAYMAYVNNLSGWVGLANGHSRAIVRIKAIKDNTGNFLTDARVAEALTKMPIFMRRSPNLRLLCNSTAAFTLQKSRSTVVGSKTDAPPLQFAAQPTESNGVPIILTDSIGNAEA